MTSSKQTVLKLSLFSKNTFKTLTQLISVNILCLFLMIRVGHALSDENTISEEMQKKIFPIHGFENFYLNQTITRSINHLQKNYGIHRLYNQIPFLVTPFDPHLLLAQKSNTTYSRWGIPFNYQQQTFYIPIEKILLRQSRLKEIQFLYSDNQFFIKHFQIKTIDLSKSHELAKINPALKHLKLFYFKDHLYLIYFSVKLKWKKIREHYLQIIQQLGYEKEFTQPGLKDSIPSNFISSQSGKYKFSWLDKNITLNLELQDDFKSSTNTYSKDKINKDSALLNVTIINNQLNKKQKSYLNGLYDHTVFYLLEELEKKKELIIHLSQIQQLKKK